MGEKNKTYISSLFSRENKILMQFSFVRYISQLYLRFSAFDLGAFAIQGEASEFASQTTRTQCW